jgi:hypothetical protein
MYFVFKAWWKDFSSATGAAGSSAATAVSVDVTDSVAETVSVSVFAARLILNDHFHSH